MAKAVFDIESDGLYEKATKIHCLVIKDLSTNKKYSYRPEVIEAGLKHLEKFDVIIGHNIIDFDIPLIKKLYPHIKLSNSQIDTIILSRLLDCDRPNALGCSSPHSLEAYGVRLGIPKVENEQWDVFTEHMLTRCEVDVEITTEVFKSFMKEIKDDKDIGVDWAESIKLEFKVAKIVSQQQQNGWLFDVPYCKKVINQIDSYADKYKRYLDKAPWPYSVENLGEYYPWKRDKEDYLVKQSFKPAFMKQYYGKVSKLRDVVSVPFSLYVPETDKWVEITTLEEKPELNTRFEKIFAENNQQVEGLFTLVQLNVFSYTSNTQLVNYMLELGWRPSQFTEKGSPQIGEEDLGKVLGKYGKVLQSYNDILSVRSKLSNPKDPEKGLLNNVRPDGRIPALCIPQATPTGRGRHALVANIGKANVEGGTYLYYPDGKVPFGTEQREMFIVPEGYKLVGADASGLEVRMLAHYMDDLLFIEEVTSVGFDIHEFNRVSAGLETRAQAKTLYYCFMYGGGDAKVGKIVGGGTREGLAIKEMLFSKVPNLEKLLSTVESRVKNFGFLIGLDGRRLNVRKEHAGLNLLLQSAGAIVMKVAMVLAHKYFENQGISQYVKQVGFFHDEFQMEVKEEYAEQVGQLLKKAIIDAGKVLKLRCPLDAEYKIGNNWAETH